MRPQVEIPNSPTDPYPIVVKNAEVIPGFGRGSSEMGIPTANVPIDSSQQLKSLETGVYFGFVRVLCDDRSQKRPPREISRVDGKSSVTLTYGEGLTDADKKAFPMVMSLGWNPYFKNKQKACELHIIHNFAMSFYGASVNFNVLGYIRPELDYTTLEALIKDIQIDIDTARNYLKTREYKKWASEV